MAEHLKPQARPHRHGGPNVWQAVLDDMAARDEFGIAKYGGPLEPHDGRRTLADAYQESLDQTVYLKQALMEGDERENWFRCWRVCFMMLQGFERSGEWRVDADQQEEILRVFGSCKNGKAVAHDPHRRA